MKTITSAQADFRANDRDGNRINDFWRKDIAGLYTLIPEHDRRRNPAHPEPIKLIELSIAAADDRPTTDIDTYAVRSAKGGYRYRTLRFEDEDEPDPDRFAACAFPDSRSAGRWTYIISHWNTVYKKDLGSGRGIHTYPADPKAAGWIRLD